MKLKRAGFLLILYALFGSSGMCAQDQHAEYWKKHDGLAPLEIRVFVDGVQAKGMFDLARQYRHKPIPTGEAGQKLWESMLIPIKVGQKFTLRVEVAKRDSEQWVDVTKNPKLEIDSATRVISINPDKSGGKVAGDSRFPDSTDLGVKTVIFYFSDHNIKDEQFAYTEIYFDVKGKP